MDVLPAQAKPLANPALMDMSWLMTNVKFSNAQKVSITILPKVSVSPATLRFKTAILAQKHQALTSNALHAKAVSI